jgi:hypothetical protein
LFVKNISLLGYSNFKKIRTVVKKFELDIELAILFPYLKPHLPSEWLNESLAIVDSLCLLPIKNQKQRESFRQSLPK